MTAATDTLALLAPDTPDTWPQGILAAADLREQRAKAATTGRWVNDGKVVIAVRARRVYGVAEADLLDEDAEHIAAEATPAHALAAVRRWRGVVERHGAPSHPPCKMGHWQNDDRRPGVRHWVPEPCLDLTEIADEARAYLGGAA